VLPGGVELGDLRRDGGEEAERERREPERPEDDEEDEESELADPPPLRAARFSPEERQDRGSLALHVPDELTRNAVDLLPEGGLEAKLKLGRPLRVKLGIDVTSPDIHVGRAVPLQRMRAFQDAGHVGVLIVGDYTTRIGDPSGRSAERPILSDEEIDRNARTYLDQAMVILDPERTEVRYNGEWLASLGYADVVRLARTITVARILERDDFSKRYAAREPISVSELLYPLMQAYDSVAVEADVELGGTDQLYNLLAGREVMPHYGLEPQVVLTTPLLLSWDGAKMSSSVGNNIPLKAPPEEMFGRTMRIPDAQLEEWWRLVAERPVPHGEPMEAKLELARFIVRRSWGEQAAREAEEHFTRVVRRHEAPERVPDVRLPAGDQVHLPALLVAGLGVGSTSEARRLIEQGGVKVNGEPVAALDVARGALAGALLQVGKRRFARLTA
jgi:tyrosyl-tRNA synthetase